jgi:hypothetical protein
MKKNLWCDKQSDYPITINTADHVAAALGITGSRERCVTAMSSPASVWHGPLCTELGASIIPPHVYPVSRRSVEAVVLILYCSFSKCKEQRASIRTRKLRSDVGLTPAAAWCAYYPGRASKVNPVPAAPPHYIPHRLPNHEVICH